MCLRIIFINPTNIHKEILKRLYFELAREKRLTLVEIYERKLPAVLSFVTISDLPIVSPYFNNADLLINPFSKRTIDKYLSAKTKLVDLRSIAQIKEISQKLYLVPEVLIGYAIGRYTNFPSIPSLPEISPLADAKEILWAFETGYNFAKTRGLSFDIFYRRSLSVELTDLFFPGEEKYSLCGDCLSFYLSKSPTLEEPQKVVSKTGGTEEIIKIKESETKEEKKKPREESVSIPIKINKE